MLRAEARTTLGDTLLDATLEVEPGRCLALAGPSGAGKTSVLRIVAGLLRPAAGRVECGADTWLDTDRGIDVAPERRHVGYVFQEHALFAHLPAWRNVAFGLAHLPRGERRARAHELLERFGIGRLADARPATLSGGERQRVALARALAPDPSVLLLDEPLSALDTRTRAAASRELAAVLQAASVPAILVTHDFAEASLLGDEVAVMDGGRVVQRGSAAALAAAPATAFVADFTGAVVLTGTAERGPGDLTRVQLDGGGAVSVVDVVTGPVALSVHPWEIALAPEGATDAGSARNHLRVRVTSVTPVGNRVRVGLVAPQPLTAEVTAEAAAVLDLLPGCHVVAGFKATGIRVLPLR
ncbi:MAG: molybdate transport system ATP-binding protein [Solirubrobacteraceae bacterium]|nr:molybdate transport system ATP-binding protein [Solirubrobacteraceae bacterium]